MTNNQLQYWDLLRKQRADAETMRANRAREQLSRDSNRIASDNSSRQYQIGMLNAQTNASQAIEQQRANISRETETRRSNRAQELNTMYSNLTQRGTLYESSRSNQSRENISRMANNISSINARNQSASVANQYLLGTMQNRTQMESVRNQAKYNAGQLELNSKRLANEYRFNQLNLELSKRRADIEESKVNQQLLSLQEAIRHNKTSEYINAFSTSLFTGLKLGLGGKK